MRIKFVKNRNRATGLIKEIKEDQVLKRLDSEKFNKLLKNFSDNIHYLGPDNFEKVKGAIRYGITQNIPERYKGEFLNWSLSIITKMLKIKKFPGIRSPELFTTWIYGYRRGGSQLNITGKSFYELKEKKRDKFLTKNSIYEIESFTELAKITREAQWAYTKWLETNVEKEELKGVDLDQHKIFENESWEVYIPKTRGAAVLLGKGTDWCTARMDNNQYYTYHEEDDPLVIFISKHYHKVRYQFHYGRREFMDSSDSPIDYYKEEDEDLFQDEGQPFYFEYSSHFDELNNIIINNIKRNRYTSHIKDIADWIDTQRTFYEWYDDGWEP